MKTTKYLGFFIATLMAASFLQMLQPTHDTGAATITRGITFGTTDLVTNVKLHQLVDNATISAIGTADFSDSAISNVKIAANAVTTDKVLDGNLLGTDFLDRTLTFNLYGTNSVDGIALNTNITTRAGLWDLTLTRFTANSITNTAVLGVTTSTGAGSSGAIPKLNASGVFDSSMVSAAFGPTTFTSTNCAIVAGGLLTQAHGLGGVPNLVQMKIVCTSADNSYSVNDEVWMPFAVPASGSNTGASVYQDASNIYVRFGSSAGVFPILDKSSGAFGTITASKWVLVLKGYK